MDKQPSLTPEQWQSHIAAWKASGITQADYCKAHGLVVSSFWYWKKKQLTPLAPSAEITPASFIPLAVINDKPSLSAQKEGADSVSHPEISGISLHIGNTYRIDLMPGFDTATLRQALSILRD